MFKLKRVHASCSVCNEVKTSPPSEMWGRCQKSASGKVIRRYKVMLAFLNLTATISTLKYHCFPFGGPLAWVGSIEGDDVTNTVAHVGIR